MKFICLDNFRISVRVGFTLAEILITLGIIGVVAAITIPTLVNQYETVQYRAAFKKTFNVISRAYQNMLNDCNATDISQLNGTACGANPGYNTTGIMLFHFPTYFETADVSTTPSLWNPNCKYFNGAGMDFSAQPNASSFILKDGTPVLMVWVFPSGSPIPTNFNIYVDLNGNKGPNIMGKDVQLIDVLGNKVVPNGSAESVSNNYEETTCAVGSNGRGCAIKLFMDKPLPY